MNKELIKKYSAEFSNWLNGGKILAYYKKDDEPKWWTDEESISCGGNDNFSNIIEKSLSPDDVLIVIDDSYSIYRKALAEGKIVEVATDYNDVDGYIWKSMEDEEFHHFSIDEIRIKPEEPKFKVGDWVRDLRDNRVFQINSVNFNLKLSTKNTVYVHWQPKKGELVILKDKNSIISIIKYNGETDVCPFIGEITWLHKKD